MERIKMWYLHCLLERNPTPTTGLEYFVRGIRDLEQHCRDCYEEQIDLTSDGFVEMMVVDGCFIIELFRKFTGQVEIKDDDPVFHKSWMHPTLINDLLLLENQLPWKVLRCLFDLTSVSRNPLSLPELTKRYFKGYTLGMYRQVNGASENKHLLDFIRNSLFRLPHAQIAFDFEDLCSHLIPSVTDLANAGVIFCSGHDDTHDVFDVTFTDGIMRIPRITLHKNGESLFRNLVAYEQCEPSHIDSITSYAVLLDHLIRSEEDVEFLIKRGIIENLSGSDTAWFLSSLSNDGRVYKFTYAELYRKVNHHCHSRWNVYQRQLRTLFQNPLDLLNFSNAALVVTASTVIQTICSILSYNKSQ